MITKKNLVDGAYEELRISGLTVNPTPEDVISAIQVLDDVNQYMVDVDGMDTGYIQPDEYGQSDPDDIAGIENWLARPLKVVLAYELAASYGKQYDGYKYDQAKKMLAKGTRVNITAKYPETLPTGLNNQDTYSPYFYNGNQPKDEC